MSERLRSEYQTLFPYDEPRESQVDGMDTIGQAAENNGIVTMEGACGTGKTLTALVPQLSHIRSSKTDAEQVLIVTSVKQQMDAFKDEVERINTALPDGVRPITAITLVGLPDVHPFVDQGLITENAYDQIDALREGARMLVTEERYDYGYDDLYHHAKQSGEEDTEFAYPAEIPELEGIEYDPYYAQYRAAMEDVDEDDTADIIPFDTEYAGLLSVDDLRDICARAGTCPHSMMRLALEHVDLVIGNYNHVFDPRTVERMTNPLIDESTLAVFDEAHNLVPRVRSFLSQETSIRSLLRAQNELDEVVMLARLSKYEEDTVRRIARAAKRDQGIPSSVSEHKALIEDLEDVFTKPGTLTETIDDIIDGRDTAGTVLSKADVAADDLESYSEYLGAFAETVASHVADETPLSEGQSIQLRDPKEPGTDKLTNWTLLNDSFESDPMKYGELYGHLVASVRDELTDPSKTPNCSARASGKVLTAWYEKDHIHYYRAIEIDNRYQETSDLEYDWQREFKAELTLHNCIPRDEIADVLSTFGSAVLMSATLEPIDVYHHTTGISKLEEAGCPVYTCRYGLAFPEENRLTMGVPAPKFKHENRGKTFTKRGPNTGNNTRETYRNIIFDIVGKTPGNVLVAMPNYSEAEWIGSLLEQSYLCKSDDVYIDESSSNDATSEMKEEFFSSDNGVLVTGARGTLVEGVDYIGDRLQSVVVCGVPITNTQSDYKRAIEAAYDEIFDDTRDVDGFTLAFTIPAVWKTRQAIGRVIRTNEDIGSRIFVDERYTDASEWDSVNEFLSPSERDEMRVIPSEDVGLRLESFWNMHDIDV